jgi:pyruvate-ferredoxin/flavodoxin oxidoreductase
MGTRTNTIMQTCFFAISGVLPRDKAIEKIKKSIKKTYGARAKRSCARTSRRWTTPSPTASGAVPARATSTIELPPVVPAGAPEFVQAT